MPSHQSDGFSADFLYFDLVFGVFRRAFLEYLGGIQLLSFHFPHQYNLFILLLFLWFCSLEHYFAFNPIFFFHVTSTILVVLQASVQMGLILNQRSLTLKFIS